MKIDNIRLSIIFDNDSCCNSALTSLWGFSALIETPNGNILFDTGSNGRVLLKNLKKRDIDISSIDNIFISHTHWDHIGGLDSILELNSRVKIFTTSYISKNFIRDLNSLSKGVVTIGDTPTKILEDIYSTGAIGDEREQSLILETTKGLVIVSGCAHGGIENIAKRAKEYFNRDILLLVGGFHLHNRSDREVLEIIDTLKKLNTIFISPSHCTGKRAKELFKSRFKDNYIEGGLGIDIDLKRDNII